VATNQTISEIIASVLQLPLEDRAQIYHALHESLIDESIDHGPIEPADEVDAAWGEEIARRVADIASGRVKTISSEEAERIIRGDARRGF
jgi:putative addiction module component (TIGR02574 family)